MARDKGSPGRKAWEDVENESSPRGAEHQPKAYFGPNSTPVFLQHVGALTMRPLWISWLPGGFRVGQGRRTPRM